MMGVLRGPAFVAALGVACAFPQPLLAFAASKLVPHRAIYEMTLDEARSASGITGIDGRMVFEFTGSPCDGYSLNMRMVTQMTDSQGQPTSPISGRRPGSKATARSSGFNRRNT
jgi:hypothetical protein